MEDKNLSATPPKEKHIELDLAISKIDGVLSRVQTLAQRVTGSAGPPDAEACDTVRPALVEVLSGGASQIDEKCSQIYAVLDQLEESLF